MTHLIALTGEVNCWRFPMLEIVAHHLLEELASTALVTSTSITTPDVQHDGAKSRSGRRFTRFDHTAEGVRGYLESHGVDVMHNKQVPGGVWLYLSSCPVVPECKSENQSDIGVWIGDDGKIAYKNQHDRGDGIHWIDVRDVLEPGYREFAQSQKRGSTPDSSGPEISHEDKSEALERIDAIISGSEAIDVEETINRMEQITHLPSNEFAKQKKKLKDRFNGDLNLMDLDRAVIGTRRERAAEAHDAILALAPDLAVLSLTEYAQIRQKISDTYKDLSLRDLDRTVAELRPKKRATKSPVPDYRETPDGYIHMRPALLGELPVMLTNFTARIVRQVSETDGIEANRQFEIEAWHGQKHRRFTITVSEFLSMHWPGEHIGADAIVHAGISIRDHARVAIQTFSGEPPEKVRYLHTGWAKIGPREDYGAALRRGPSDDFPLGDKVLNTKDFDTAKQEMSQYVTAEMASEGDGTRTRNLRIDSPMLSVANKGLTSEFARQFALDDPDLVELIERWPDLDEPIKDAILALIRAKRRRR